MSNHVLEEALENVETQQVEVGSNQSHNVHHPVQERDRYG